MIDLIERYGAVIAILGVLGVIIAIRLLGAGLSKMDYVRKWEEEQATKGDIED